MTKRQKKGFEIEMPFSPSAFLAGPMKGSFYDDEAKCERVPASGSFRIPPAPQDSRIEEKSKNKKVK